MSDLPTPEDFLEMLKNREALVKTLLKDFATSRQHVTALQRMQANIDGAEDQSKIRLSKVFQAYGIALTQMQEMNQRMFMILLAYLGSDSFQTDAAKVAMKLGRGEDAMKELFRQKMQGR